MQTYDAIIFKRKVRYLDLAAICESAHTSPLWMKDDDNHLKPFKTKKKTKGTKKISRRDLQKGCCRHIAYEL